MAGANIPQWSVLCICESPADHHCNTCGDLLCSRCRSLHLKSRASSDHLVVPYAERIEPQSTSSIKCSAHQNQISDLWCKTCDTPACLQCVTAAEHKNHDFQAIADKICFRRKTFQQKLKIQNNSLPEWERLSSDSKQMQADYEDHANKIDAAMTKQANEIGTQVTNILVKHQKQLREKQSTQIEVLRATEKRISDGIICIKNKNQKIEDILRDRKPSTLLQPSLQETTVDYTLTAPPSIPPTYHAFTPGHIDTRALEQMFGSLALDRSKPSHNESTVTPASLNDKELKSANMIFTHKKQQEVTNNAQRKVLLIRSPSTIFSVKIPYHVMVPFISCCNGSDAAWIATDIKELQLMRRDGRILETVTLDFEMGDMDVTKQGDLMISDSTNKCIKAVSRKIITTLFNTGMRPGGICCLMNDDILVTFPDDGKVIQYSRGGKVIQDLDSTHFRRPRFLAQNDITQDMYVCNRGDVMISSSSYVSVFSSTGSFRYNYSGDADFHPRGICTDQAGRVLITNCNKSKIHLLDKDGHFLGCINTANAGLTKPCTIGVDNDGYAWIGCRWKLGVLKYLQYQ